MYARVILLLLSLLVVMPQAINSDNYLGIDDECFRFYMAGNIHYEKGLTYADSLEAHARKIGENRSIVLAEWIRALYWSHQKDHARRQAQLLKLRKKAKELNDEREYYLSFVNEADDRWYEFKYKEALDILETLHNEAARSGSKYGLWRSYTSYANIYGRMGSKKLAVEYSQKAIDIAHDIKPHLSTFANYHTLAANVDNDNQRIAYARKSLEEANNRMDSAAAYTNLYNLYHIYNKRAEYDALYNILSSPKGKEMLGVRSSLVVELNHLLYKKKYNDIISLLFKNKHLLTDQEFLRNLEVVYKYAGRYKEAYQTHKELDSMKEGNNFVSLSTVLEQFDLNNRHSELARTKLQQDLQKAQENLDLAKAEAQRAEDAAKTKAALILQKQQQATLERDSANNIVLQLEHQHKAALADKAHAALRQAKLDTELEENLRNSERSRSRIIIASIIGLLTLLALFIVGYITISRRRHTRQMLHLNKELASAIEAARNASHKKDLFLQNMSHELRTPLNAVMGLSQILTCGVPVSDEEKLEYGHDINNNVKMLQMLIDDIINISDIEKGTYSMSLHRSDIATICHDAMALAQYRVPGGVELRYDNDLPEGYQCVIDSKRAQQVIVNYLTNACKHTREGSIVVRSTLNDHPGYVTFSVTDTGEGIPADQAHNIFERFTKLNDFVQGTGLGLNICYTIALMLHGRVWLDTTYTDGARFFFEIPTNLKEDEEPINTPEKKTSPRRKSKGIAGLFLTALLTLSAFVLPTENQASSQVDWKAKYDSLISQQRKKRATEEAAVKKAMAEYAESSNYNRLQREVEENKLAIMRTQSERQKAEAARQQAFAERQEAESRQLLLAAEHARNEANAKALRMEAEQEEQQAEQANILRHKADTEARITHEQRIAHRRNVLITSIGLGTLLMAATVIFLVARSRRQRKNYKKIMCLHAELEAKKTEAVETDKIKDSFIRNMSLDIRTPLQSVLGMVQVLCNPAIETSEEEQAEYGEEIMKNINMLIASIDDILNVSDIQSGNFTVTPTTNNIAAICNSTAANVSHILPPSIKLVQQIDLPEGYQCVIDPRRAQQVLMTYISNAIKHNQSGTIILRASLDGRPNHITFSVSDPSHITDAETVRHLFDKKVGRHNIALHLCATIANKMNGHAWYDETYTDGTRFCLDIPLNLKDSLQFN